MRNLRSVPKSFVLSCISGHLIFNIALASAFVFLRGAGIFKGSIPAVAHSLAGAFLGLLVTFRTNNSYARYWEARIIWGGIMNTCRSLAIGASVWIKPREPTAARRFVECLHQYPTAVARQCRGEALDKGDHPADVCLHMQTWLHRSALPTSWDGPMGLYELQLSEQSRHVDKLTDATGALNRIIKTPLPLSYSRHTSRFLTAWCGTLPCALGAAVGPISTIVVVALISWLVLGIDSIGQLLEQPFSQPQDIGTPFDFGLPAEDLGSGVANEVARIANSEGGAFAAYIPADWEGAEGA